MKQRIYIDTSVVGGYFDDEFSADTVPFFDRVRNGEITIVVSDLLEAELLRAPKFVKNLLSTIAVEHIEQVMLTPEAIELADVVIRVMDIFGAMGWDLEQAIELKHSFNKTRAFRHGGKAL